MHFFSSVKLLHDAYSTYTGHNDQAITFQSYVRNFSPREKFPKLSERLVLPLTPLAIYNTYNIS